MSLVCISVTANGLVLLPVFPLLIEFAIEVTFPAGEGMVAGMLFAGG